jgi:FtsH-binding integral membrane protein
MSVHSAYAPAVSGPSEARLAFLRRVGLWTFGGLSLAAVVAVVSMFTVAPLILQVPFGAVAGIFGSFLFAHYLCRSLVYGEQKVAGFVMASIAEGFSFGFLLLVTIFYAGPDDVGTGLGIVAQGMALTAATALGLLVYVWFNKSDLSMVKAGLSVIGIPMLLLMVLQLVWPIGGVFGLVMCGAFVVVSGASLLYALHVVVHEMEDSMHIEAAYEITMKLLVLLWNMIQLLNRLRR